MKNFFYKDSSGKEIGPLNLSTLAQLRFAGVLNDDTQVRSEDSDKWVACREVVAAPTPPYAAMPNSPVAVASNKAPVLPPVLIVLIFIGALIYGGTMLYKNIAAKTALTYGFTLDGKEVSKAQFISKGQLPEVKVDGQVFESGDPLRPGRHQILVHFSNGEPFQRHFWVFYGTKDLGDLPLETSKGSLTVTVSLSPATVILERDGKTVDQGNTPFSKDKLNVGEYTLKIQRGDYVETRTVKVLREQQTKTQVDLNLGKVNLSAEPSDAEYTLSGNGKHWEGKLPKEIEDVPSGIYSLKVIRKGWNLDCNITVGRGEIATNKTDFPYGSISVTSEPSGLTVSTNGVEIGTTPINIGELRPDVYSILVSDGENDKTDNVSISAKAVLKRNFSFKYGSVQIASEPAGALVARKGKNVGKTPLTLNRIPVGESSIALSLDGYASTNFTVIASEGSTVSFQVKLVNERYLQAMREAHEAFNANKFDQSQNSLALALSVQPADLEALQLQEAVAKAKAKMEAESLAAQAAAKAQKLASLPWLDFDQMIRDCIVKSTIYYQGLEISGGTTFNEARFADVYLGKTYKFDSTGWKIEKIENDGSVIFRSSGSRDATQLGQNELWVTPSVANKNEFLSIKDSQRVIIKAKIKGHDKGDFFSRVLQRISLEDAELLNK